MEVLVQVKSAPQPRPTNYLLRLFARWTNSSTAVDTTATIAHVGERLSGFAASTEGHFLRVGERLLALQAETRQLAAAARELARVRTHDEAALSLLDELLRATSAWGLDASLLESVQTIQASATALHDAVGSIREIVRNFDFLAVMTRTEAARLDGQGETFAGLSNTVTTLSAQIRERIGHTAGFVEELLATVAHATEVVRNAENERRENLAPLSNRLAEELRHFREWRNDVAHAAQALGERSTRIASAIGDVVMALQAHDIVRQQVEHVVEALEQARVETLDGEMLRLQSAQLNNSHATFARSIAKTHAALTEIEHGTADVAAEASRALGGHVSNDASTQESRFERLSRGMLGIVQLLDNDASATQRLTQATTQVEARLNEIAGAIAGVQAVGIEMQRIALNAAIQATRLGSKGAALEIVAGSIQRLAASSEETSNTLNAQLETMREAAWALGSVTGYDTDDWSGRLRESVGTLNAAQGEAESERNRTITLSATLQQHASETIATLGEQSDALELLEDAARELEAVAASVVATSSNVPARSATGYAANYTMEAERTVHAAMLQAAGECGGTQIEAEPVALGVHGDVSEDDDGVELF